MAMAGTVFWSLAVKGMMLSLLVAPVSIAADLPLRLSQGEIASADLLEPGPLAPTGR